MGLILIFLGIIHFLVYGLYTFNADNLKNNTHKLNQFDDDFDDFNNYSSDEISLDDKSSYWYIFVEYTGPTTRWRSYKVIEIDVPYYDVNKVLNVAYPEVNNDDEWIGVTFFKRVSFETYKSYNN